MAAQQRMQQVGDTEHIPRGHDRGGDRGHAARGDAEAFARVLVWLALGWTVAMSIVVLFFANFAGHQPAFDRMGPWAVLLALVPIAVISLPLIAVVSERVKRITPIVAVFVTLLVIGSVVFAGGFFIPSAFALLAAALIELSAGG